MENKLKFEKWLSEQVADKLLFRVKLKQSVINTDYWYRSHGSCEFTVMKHGYDKYKVTDGVGLINKDDCDIVHDSFYSNVFSIINDNSLSSDDKIEKIKKYESLG